MEAPRLLLAIMYGLDSVRWAMVLVKWGEEKPIHELFDWLHQGARSRPSKTEQFSQFWQAVSWKHRNAPSKMVRPSRSTATITKDLDKFNDYMSREAASPTKVRVPRVMPSLQVLVEQPRSSVMFELDIWREMGPLFDFQSVGTFHGGALATSWKSLRRCMATWSIWSGLSATYPKRRWQNMRQKVLCILWILPAIFFGHAANGGLKKPWICPPNSPSLKLFAPLDGVSRINFHVMIMHSCKAWHKIINVFFCAAKIWPKFQYQSGFCLQEKDCLGNMVCCQQHTKGMCFWNLG